MADAKINPSMPNSGNRYIDVMVGILTLSLYWLITAKLHPSWVYNTKKEDSQGTVTILWKNAEESEPKYAEANPDLPSNTPDQTDYFSTKDQQAAQPIDSKDLTLQTSQLPQLDGTSQNLKVVSAPLPLPTVPNNEQAQPASKIKQSAHTNQNKAGMAPQELNDQIEDKENEGLSYDAKERTYPNEKKSLTYLKNNMMIVEMMKIQFLQPWIIIKEQGQYLARPSPVALFYLTHSVHQGLEKSGSNAN